MQPRRINPTEGFIAQLTALPRGLQVAAGRVLDDLANALDPSRVDGAAPDATGIDHMWIVRRAEVTVIAAVYDEVMRVDGLTVRPNS